MTQVAGVPDAGSVGAFGTPAHHFVGLDVSWTGTGIASSKDGSVTIKTKASEEDADRMDKVVRAVLDWCRDASLVVIEGYSFGSMQGRERMGEMTGAVKYILFKKGVPFVVVAPTQVKKYSTGKGNADKDAVLASAIRRFEFEGAGNNEADAWTLMCMAKTHYTGSPAVPETHAEALKKVTWPELSPVL